MIKNSNQIYGWNSDLHVIAHLWSEGSIIKSGLMKTLEKEFKIKASILEMDIFKKYILEAQNNWNSVLNYMLLRTDSNSMYFFSLEFFNFYNSRKKQR